MDLRSSEYFHNSNRRCTESEDVANDILNEYNGAPFLRIMRTLEKATYTTTARCTPWKYKSMILPQRLESQEDNDLIMIFMKYSAMRLSVPMNVRCEYYRDYIGRELAANLVIPDMVEAEEEEEKILAPPESREDMLKRIGNQTSSNALVLLPYYRFR